MFISRVQRFRYGLCRRLRDILADAPWSNHDLLVSISLMLMGTILIIDPDAFSKLRALAYLHHRGGAQVWSLLFLGCGVTQFTVTLWRQSPPFWIRLLARMCGAFCFVLLALSSALFSVTTPSMVVYLMLAIWSVWGILRTHASGR